MNTILQSRDLSQLITEPTQRSGHTLDWVIIHRSYISELSNLSLTDPQLSDHMSISFELSMTKPPLTKRTINTRNYRLINYEDFCADLKIACNKISNSVDKSCAYQEELSSVINKHAPLRSRCRTGYY